MPSLQFPEFSIFRLLKRGITKPDATATTADVSSHAPSNEDDVISSPNIECYACTQVGVPVFHSTSCDRAQQQPEWEACAGSSLVPIGARKPGSTSSSLRARSSKGRRRHPHTMPPLGLFGPIIDPRSERVRRWNRAILLARGAALAIDPVFFYALSIGRGGSCLYMDGVLAAVVTVIRTCVDAVHLWHVWLQFRLAYVSRESLVVGCGKLVWDARAIAEHYVRSFKGFWFDLYVILPIPQMSNVFDDSSASAKVSEMPGNLLLKKIQEIVTPRRTIFKGHELKWISLLVEHVSPLLNSLPHPTYLLQELCSSTKGDSLVVFWTVVPKLLRQDQIGILMTILLLIFLFQFLPKVHHSISLMRKMQKVTGYIFGTIWWGFGLNLIAYFIASHVVGGCWYVLAIQRVAACLAQQCNGNSKCTLSLSCSKEVCYKLLEQANGVATCDANSTMTRKSFCLDDHGPFSYGIYGQVLPVLSSNAIVIKILYPISWGLFQLSTFGNNLTPTSQWAEVLFCMCLVLGGLMLFTLLIGNIQVFLHTVMAKKRKMQLRCRDMEWWMKRRQLPSRLRQRVRHFERQNWVTTGGVNEMELIKDLPEGLRRDIKRYLCLQLIKKVPLFHCLDDLILDNICDRVKPLIYCKDEKIMREGDPVQRMVFIVRGRIKSNQNLSKGMVATDLLEPGSFLGDELISWCLRRPFLHRLPASSATFVCLESTEAFGLGAYDLRYITDHFRYKFANENLKRTLRYHSSNWRTWAAVNIQFAWRRYVKRTRGCMVGPPVSQSGDDDGEKKLLQIAAMFMSFRPHDHLD